MMMMKLATVGALLAVLSQAHSLQNKNFQIRTPKELYPFDAKFYRGNFQPIELLPYNHKHFFTNTLNKYPPANDRPATSTPDNDLEALLEKEWNLFKIKFNKTYSGIDEDRQRKENYIENRNKIIKFNQEFGLGKHHFVQKLSEYGDFLNHEFNQKVNGFNKTNLDGKLQDRLSSTFIHPANVQVPPYIDWREVGAVTSVKRQGKCGACYAFAAAGAIEGHTFRKNRVLIELSAQNLIDCSKTFTNSGCAGGLMEYAFEYVKQNKGIDTEFLYPFEGMDGEQCRYREDACGAKVTGYVLLDEGDEKGLEDAVATLGPVSVAIDAHSESFQFYSNGIYYEPKCSSSPDRLNHAVLVVGYGTEPSGYQYWLVKNSYGPEWGIGGYMKIARNVNNHCGIASYAVYPLV